MKKLLLVFLLLPIMALAQGIQRSNTAQQSVSGYVKTLPGASITVCTSPSCGAITVYSDPALTLPIAQPFSADPSGNYSYFVTPGTYLENITSPGVTPQTYLVFLNYAVSGGNPSFHSIILLGSIDGAITIQPQAHAGTYNFNMPTTAGSPGQVLTSAGGGGAPMTWTTPATSAVTSVFGRTGAVVATFGDYPFSLISGNISTSQMDSGTGASIGTFWRGDGTWASVGSSGGVTSFNGRTGAVVPTGGDYSFSLISGNIFTTQMHSGISASSATYWRGDGTWDSPVTAFNGRFGAVAPTSGDYSFSQIGGNISTSQMNSGSGATSSTFWRGDGTWAAPSASIITNASTGTTGKFAVFATGATCSTTNTDSDTCSGSFTITGSPFSGTPTAVCGPGFISAGFPHLIAAGATAANTIGYTIGNGTSAGAVISQYASLYCMAWGN